MTEVTERNLSLALEIEVLPDSLVVAESGNALTLEILVPVAYRAAVSLFRFLVFVLFFVFHILLMLLKFLF
jgi:hypothetical protein